MADDKPTPDTASKENDSSRNYDGAAENENGERNLPLRPVGFWDPRLNHTRKEVMSKFLLTSETFQLIKHSVHKEHRLQVY
jgi:hypothetical protein